MATQQEDATASLKALIEEGSKLLAQMAQQNEQPKTQKAEKQNGRTNVQAAKTQEWEQVYGKRHVLTPNLKLGSAISKGKTDGNLTFGFRKFKSVGENGKQRFVPTQSGIAIQLKVETIDWMIAELKEIRKQAE